MHGHQWLRHLAILSEVANPHSWWSRRSQPSNKIRIIRDGSLTRAFISFPHFLDWRPFGPLTNHYLSHKSAEPEEFGLHPCVTPWPSHLEPFTFSTYLIGTFATQHSLLNLSIASKILLWCSIGTAKISTPNHRQSSHAFYPERQHLQTVQHADLTAAAKVRSSVGNRMSS